MSYDNLRKLADKVEAVLKASQVARDDDHALSWLVWTKFFNASQNISGHDLMLKLYHSEIPPFESISRCRRRLQERGKYPASDKVKDRRTKLEDTVRGQLNLWV